MITEQRLGGRIGGWTCDSRDINLPVQARPAIRAGCVASRLKGRKLRRLLVAAVACLSFAGPSFAEPGQTIAAATMRKMPSVSSRVVQHIPADADRRVALRRRLVLRLLAQSVRLHPSRRGCDGTSRRWRYVRRGSSDCPRSSHGRSRSRMGMGRTLCGLRLGLAALVAADFP